MEPNPVKSEVYDEEWLASAWGDKANKELFEKDILIPRPRLARALELVDIRPENKLLDIACGRAEMPLLAAERGTHAIGIDYSAAAVKFAKRLCDTRIKKFKPSLKIDLIRSDACSLPFKDSTFDRITMLDIIEHLVPSQLELMFHEIRRVLKADGYAVIHTLPNRWVYDITFPMLNRIFRKIPKEPRSTSEKEIHINEQDLRKLHKTLNTCGLKHKLWLEQYIPAQARWNRGKDQYGDNRDSIYPAFEGVAGTILEYASYTPLKLLLSNDIFGILWKEHKPNNIKMPLSLTEYITCCFSSN